LEDKEELSLSGLLRGDSLGQKMVDKEH
jgi:hypothetical protein